MMNLEAANARIQELEKVLDWWVNVRMKGFSEDQYGKRKIREVLNKKENFQNPIDKD